MFGVGGSWGAGGVLKILHSKPEQCLSPGIRSEHRVDKDKAKPQACPVCIRPSLNQPMGIRIEEKGKTMTSGFAVRPLGTIMPGLGHAVGMCGGHPLPNVLLLNPKIAA